MSATQGGTERTTVSRNTDQVKEPYPNSEQCWPQGIYLSSYLALRVWVKSYELSWLWFSFRNLSKGGWHML